MIAVAAILGRCVPGIVTMKFGNKFIECRQKKVGSMPRYGHRLTTDRTRGEE